MSKWAGVIVAGWIVVGLLVGLATDEGGKLSSDHYVPVEKKLPAGWSEAIWAKGGPRVCTGAELRNIAMPIGGIGAGQVYLGGDGRLRHWAVFNKHHNTGYGRTNYKPWVPAARIDQGFAIRVVRDGKAVTRRLDSTGIKDIRFVGEYPIATVEYRDAALGVTVTLEAFSPFIPLNAPDSGLPATVMQFTVANTGGGAAEATLAGWMENAVLLDSRQTTHATAVNRALRTDRAAVLEATVEKAALPPKTRAPELFEDFEGADYGKWTVEGEAFGTKPARGTLPEQQAVAGFRGKGLVNTYLGKDGPVGKLTSPAFTIRRPFIVFLVGGGSHKGKTCMNLVVDGKVVRTATGKQKELLAPAAWAVKDLIGREARLQIVDAATGPWGHINIDQIEFADVPTGRPADLKDRPDFGSMALALVAPPQAASVTPELPGGELPMELFRSAAPAPAVRARGPVGLADPPVARRPVAAGGHRGAVAASLSLPAGGRKAATFVVAWHFPNHQFGRFYATRFKGAREVADYVATNLDRLAGDTRRWHETYYDSTLPHWLLDRLLMPVCNLATNTVRWQADGRLWGWEGVGCCAGTCTHVWNYEHAMARLFPRLERSVRSMQDFGEGFDEATGLVGFRSNRAYAADGQCGTILKAYREHLVSADDAFLRKHWPRIRKAMEFVLARDGDEDGLITDSQHNTFDINFHGANTFVGSLYLGALRAAEEMAGLVGEKDFAARCRKAFEQGSAKTMEQLFDGEYFIQKVDLAKHARHQYGPGCLADQMFGQNWAHQLGLGHLYPPEAVRKAMLSVYRYNWTTDVGPQNARHRPERVFARAGEPGLFICTWPKSPHLPRGVRYRNEVWTGIEYQAAAGLIYEGCIEQAMNIIRGVHVRYDASKMNPFNEVECGDHYARALASWGCLLGLSGFDYDGPAGRIAFAPRVQADEFRCAFTAAEGWGTLEQKRADGEQTNTIALRWGKLRLTAVTIGLPAALKGAKTRLTVGGRDVAADAKPDADGRVEARPDKPVVLSAGDKLVVRASK